MGTRPPTALAGSPSAPASAGASPTVIDSTRPWIWPSLADQPLALTASWFPLSLPVASSWTLGKPGRSLVPVPMTAGSWSVWARRSAVKRRTSSRAHPSWTRLAAAIRVPSRAITARVTGKAGARYQGRRRSTVWIRGPVAGRRTGRPWLRLLLPLMATLATPFSASAAARSAPIRPSLPLSPAPRRADRPHVRQVVGDVGEQPPVEVRVLAEEAGLVAAVQGRVAEPGWEGAGVGQLLLGAGGGHADPVQLLADLQLAAVGEAAGEPGPAHGHPVAAQGLGVAAPHPHRRVVPPAVAGADQPAQHLQCLDPLLAQAALVEGTGAGREVGIGKEGLQGQGSPAPARACRRARRGSIRNRAMAAAAK